MLWEKYKHASDAVVKPLGTEQLRLTGRRKFPVGMRRALKIS